MNLGATSQVNGDRRPGLERAGSILQDRFAEFHVSRRRLRQAESIQLVRDRRDAASQQLGFASRPFVLCGLPVRCPPRSTLVYERRNGLFTLQITGHPDFGLPFGQDRLVPIFLATLMAAISSLAGRRNLLATRKKRGSKSWRDNGAHTKFDFVLDLE